MRKRVRRRSFAPLVYNVTQTFAATAGVSCTLGAYAIQASNGGSSPNCDITICEEGTCGASDPLTASYVQYSYVFTPASSEDSVATFSISCPGSAYVGLDNIAVVSSAMIPSVSGGQTTTITQFATTTLTQN